MIIHPSQRFVKGNYIYNRSRIEVDHRDVEIPQELWFRYPLEFKDQISDTENPFVTSLLLLASYLGEEICVEGQVSRRLLWGLNEYLQIMTTWYPNIYTPINISVDEIVDMSEESRHIGSFFSGGVDSYFTLLRHTKEQDVLYPLDYVFFVHGYDISLTDKEAFAKIRHKYERTLSHFGIQLLPISTNSREFLKKLSWNNCYGTVMAGTILGFDKLIKVCLWPSADDNMQGSDSRLVYVLSTENQEFILDGNCVPRTKKVEYISKFPVTYDSLRVCWERINGIRNCGECEKCIRTMIELELTGCRDKYSVFDSELDISKIKSVNIDTLVKKLFWKDILVNAKEKKRMDIVRNIRIALVMSAARNSFPIKLIRFIKEKVSNILRRITK